MKQKERRSGEASRSLRRRSAVSRLRVVAPLVRSVAEADPRLVRRSDLLATSFGYQLVIFALDAGTIWAMNANAKTTSETRGWHMRVGRVSRFRAPRFRAPHFHVDRSRSLHGDLQREQGFAPGPSTRAAFGPWDLRERGAEQLNFDRSARAS